MKTNFAEMTTAEIVTACEGVLTELGFKDAGAVERWEQDGVMIVSAEGTEWMIEVSGKDLCPMFEAGGTMRPEDDRVGYDDGFEVSNLEEYKTRLLGPLPPRNCPEDEDTKDAWVL